MWKLLDCAKALPVVSVDTTARSKASNSGTSAARLSPLRAAGRNSVYISASFYFEEPGGRKNSAPQYSQRMTPLPPTTWGAPQLGHLPLTTAWLMTAASEETSLPPFQST